eukprot:gene21542-32388_t
MSEALYTTKMKEDPTHGPDLLSFVASVASALMAGPVIELLGARACYAVAAPIAALVLVPTIANWIGERPAATRCNDDLIRNHWRLVLVGVGMGVLSLALAATSLAIDSPLTNLIGSLGVCVFIIAGMCWACRDNLQVAKVNGFFVLQFALHINTAGANRAPFALHINTAGANLYFFTDDASQFPAGPHFSVVFYTATLGVLGAVFGFAGILAYNQWMSEWNYRSVIVVGNIIQAVVSLLSCAVYLRWNLAWGIPDEFFMATSTAVTAQGRTAPAPSRRALM